MQLRLVFSLVPRRAAKKPKPLVLLRRLELEVCDLRPASS